MVVPDDEHGQISIEALRALVDERVKLIAITHAPTNGGLVNPAAEVGKVARQAGVLYLLDACQSAGQLDLDVAAIGCDFLSATGRKYLRGPRGTGFLYVRRAVCEQLEPMVLDLHAAHWTARDRFEIRPDARRFETGGASCAGKIGLGVAVDYALGFGLEAITARIAELSERLRRTLAEIPGVTGRDRGLVRSGIVSFTMERTRPAPSSPASAPRASMPGPPASPRHGSTWRRAGSPASFARRCTTTTQKRRSIASARRSAGGDGEAVLASPGWGESLVRSARQS